MEPLNDDELKGLLRQWEAPPAPATLQTRVLSARPANAWWKWLLTGSIRIPTPVGVLAAFLALAWILSQDFRPAKSSPQEVNFKNFQPVKELKPRIIRSSYANQ